MNDDFARYEAMKAAGETREEIARRAKSDGLDFPARIRMLRQIFSLSFPEAKEIMLRADGIAESLEEHEARFAEGIRRALEEE